MKWWERMRYSSLKNRSLIFQLKFGLLCGQRVTDFTAFHGDELARYAVVAIARGYVENLSAVLLYGTPKKDVDDMIDGLIECAIDMEQHEAYVMLLNYKHENNLYQDLTKKFEL